jgi:O-antigen/teichoic acid export membrane protein
MPTLVDWTFSQKYHDSIPFLLPLSIGWSIRSSTFLQSAAIFGLGKIHYNAYTALCALIGNIIIYPIAIYYWGLMGAAYASISGGIIIWTASNYYLNRAVRKTNWKAV